MDGATQGSHLLCREAGYPGCDAAEFKGHEGIWSPEDVFVASITLSANADAAKARELIEKAEANCLISNSMKASISSEPTIR